MERQEKTFPNQFFWGCATSAHQIEGGLTNDWTDWETSPKRIKKLKKKGLDPNDFISGHAANSFVEHNADIQCLKELHANAYRFSIDWSRIEPEEGVFDQEALDFYLDFIKKLRANKIEPFVTLWHWPIPLWLRDTGGWTSPETVKYFSRFVKRVCEHLNSEVVFWITLNEPLVYAANSYLTGIWPPQKKNPFAYLKVLKHLQQAHCDAYDIIKDIDQSNQVGISKHNIYFEVANTLPLNKVMRGVANWWWNHRFLHKIDLKQDFIGLNYYFHTRINGLSFKHEYDKVSDLNWGLVPEGMYHLLKDLKKYNKPIYITENGLADKGDQHRSWYISETLKNVHQAISEGVDVRGYFHWSLIDNFEWAEGFHPRFGLYEVDFQTFERKPRASAEFYADICKNNRLML